MDPSKHLSTNLIALRAAASLTQRQLAQRSGVPRSTLANLEAGGGNPTLRVLTALAEALRVPIEELIRPPHPAVRLFRSHELVEHVRSKVTVRELLPDAVPGAAFERLKLPPGARMRGTPHRPGTREYLCCERGRVGLWAAGQVFALDAGDVVVFRGDQAHTYGALDDEPAVAYSVVVLIPGG